MRSYWLLTVAFRWSASKTSSVTSECISSSGALIIWKTSRNNETQKMSSFCLFFCTICFRELRGRLCCCVPRGFETSRVFSIFDNLKSFHNINFLASRLEARYWYFIYIITLYIRKDKKTWGLNITTSLLVVFSSSGRARRKTRRLFSKRDVLSNRDPSYKSSRRSPTTIPALFTPHRAEYLRTWYMKSFFMSPPELIIKKRRSTNNN